jgi:PAS domain S-box-containing protein
MLKVTIALLGWFLLGGYLFYEYQEYGSALFTHLFSAENAVQTIFHGVMFLAPFITTYLGYLIYQKEKLLKKVVTEKAKEDAILGAIGEGISIQDTNFRILYQNQLHKEMVGDHIGECCYKAFQNREQVCEGCHLAMTFTDGKTHKKEQQIATDKGTVYLEITASPLTDLSGKLIAGIDVVRDVSERRLMEEKLRQSEKKYRELVETASSVILTWDTAGNITFLNDFTERFFGFSKEELLGRNVVGTIVPPAESSGRDLARLMEEIRRDPDRFRDNENENITKDGRRVWVRWANKAIVDGQGTLVGILSIGNDITQRKRAEEENDRLAKAVSIVTEGIAITDEEDRFIYLNDAHAKTYGYLQSELIGKTWRDITPKELVPLIEREMSGTLHNRDNGIWSSECPGLSKDGTVISTEVTATARWNEKGDYLGHICVVRDITERKSAEETLRESEEKFSRIFREAPLLITLSEIETGKLIEVNRKFLETSGFTQEELIGRTVLEIGWTTEEQRSRLVRILHEQGRVAGIELSLRSKGGKEIICLYSGELITVNGKQVLLSIAQDITERKRVEEALQRSEEEYRMVVNNINEIIYRISFKDDPLRGRVAFLSGPTEKIVGFHSEEFLDDPELWVSLIHPDDTPALFKTTKEMLETRQPAVREFRIRHKREPEYVWFEDKVFPQFDENGEVIGYFGVARDVSERKKAEEDRARLEAQLLQAQKMEAVGQLAGGIAHDFNNMLTAIIGYASLLEAKLGTDSPLRPYVDQILSSSEKSANLTSQLLAFSRKQIMSPKETDLNELIRGMEMLLKSLIGEDVEFRTCFADMHLMAMVDRGQIEQVLLNLCANARDAMPHGGLLAIGTDVLELDEKGIRTYDLDQSGRYALIAVTDTGHGMEETTRVRIFEPFYTTKEIGKGTGLGLSIVYGIIRQHGGNINVYSEPGKGTTFKIFLPLILSQMETARKERGVTPRGGSEAILVAEDDDAVRTLTSHILREAGYSVIEAVDGDDAINKFMGSRDSINLAMLDVVMPKKSGKEVSDAIRKIKSGIRVLLTSGYTADIINTKGITEEGLDFISKPITPNNLLKKVREILDT